MDIKRLINIFRFVEWIKVIAITGGPCAGKSTFLEMAINLLKKHGFIVIVVPEVARELISSGIVPCDSRWRRSIDFQKHVLMHTLKKEASFFEALADMDLKGQKVVFLCDRGIPDGAAYCGEEAFKALLDELGISFSDGVDRYDGVIHMVTAAIGAQEYYKTDGVRTETLEEAAAIDIKTREVWHTHLHFSLIDNSTPFDQKILRALIALQRLLPMPNTPKEIERKYHVKNFKPEMIPSGTKSFKIVQTYLDRADRPGIECRVRVKITDGVPSYTYTEKTSTEVEGVRGEDEKQITKEESDNYVSQYTNSNWNTIQKTRYKIPYGKFMLELDVYEGDLAGLVVIEVECSTVEEMSEQLVPDCFDCIDVTSDKHYSNKVLAMHGLPN